MEKKLCPKIILEGTRLTLKTEIAFSLNEHPRIVGPRKYRYHSPLISAEWCAFTNFPWGRGLINYLPEEEPMAMETYATWMRLFELQRYYSWIVDRFHVSTAAFQAQRYGAHPDFRWLEERLAAVGFRLVFCRRSPESFAAAREARLNVSGKPSQYDDLGLFIREQEFMARAVEASLLPSLTVDVSGNNVSASVEAIADWMEGSGALWCD